jgi:hypothetical protein
LLEATDRREQIRVDVKGIGPGWIERERLGPQMVLIGRHIDVAMARAISSWISRMSSSLQ